MHTVIIPRTIHLISPERSASRAYRANIERIQQLHPSWQVKIWDDAAAFAIVEAHFPEWKQYFTTRQLAVQKTDIFRVMVTYLHGGFYLDMEMQCLKSLDDLCGHEMVLGVEKTLTKEECLAFDHTYPVRIASYMFGSRAQHPFWLDFLQTAMITTQAPLIQEPDVLECTGPALLTDTYHEKGHNYQDIVLLTNHEKSCPGSCGPASCHFGDYAVHLHIGSWRWENDMVPAIVQKQVQLQC